jgi:hypothetical protein
MRLAPRCEGGQPEMSRRRRDRRAEPTDDWEQCVAELEERVASPLEATMEALAKR